MFDTTKNNWYSNALLSILSSVSSKTRWTALRENKSMPAKKRRNKFVLRLDMRNNFNVVKKIGH
jgi:hypothetical protein